MWSKFDQTYSKIGWRVTLVHHVSEIAKFVSDGDAEVWPKFGQTNWIIDTSVALRSIFTDDVLTIAKCLSDGDAEVWQKFGQTDLIIGRTVALLSNFTDRVLKIIRYVYQKSRANRIHCHGRSACVVFVQDIFFAYTLCLLGRNAHHSISNLFRFTF